MNKLLLTVLCFGLVIFTSCGVIGGGRTDLTLNAAGKEYKIDKNGIAIMSQVSPIAAQIQFSNTEKEGERFKYAEKEGDIWFQITVQKAGEFEAGTYKPGASTKEGEFDDVTVSYFEERNKNVEIEGEKAKGSVEITEFTKEKISGTIDIQDGENSLKGNFSAEIPPRK